MTFEEKIKKRIDFQKKNGRNWTLLMFRCYDEKLIEDAGKHYLKKEFNYNV